MSAEDAVDASDAAVSQETVPDRESEALLEVRGLDAGYGDLQILTDVDLDVADEEYVTIVGPNGAGKSTVMKSVFGLTNLMGGTVTFEGADITGLRPEEIIREGIGYVPQNDNIFTSLTVRENLEMGAYILDSFPQDALDAVFERFPILEERQSQKAGTMSGGQRQMLAMGRALMHRGPDGRTERQGGAPPVRPGVRPRERTEPVYGRWRRVVGRRTGAAGLPRRVVAAARSDSGRTVGTTSCPQLWCETGVEPRVDVPSNRDPTRGDSYVTRGVAPGSGINLRRNRTDSPTVQWVSSAKKAGRSVAAAVILSAITT